MEALAPEPGTLPYTPNVPPQRRGRPKSPPPPWALPALQLFSLSTRPLRAFRSASYHRLARPPRPALTKLRFPRRAISRSTQTFANRISRAPVFRPIKARLWRPVLLARASILQAPLDLLRGMQSTLES